MEFLEHAGIGLYAFIGLVTYFWIRRGDDDDSPYQIKSMNIFGATMIGLFWPLFILFRLTFRFFDWLDNK